MNRWAPCVLIALIGAAVAQSPAPNTLPPDIDPRSLSRLPPIARADLDESGQKTYDAATKPGATLAGLQGPAGLQLYSVKTTEHLQALNRYLRYDAGIAPALRELAILTVARAMDNQFEWVAHEKVALKEGAAPEAVDAIKNRKPTTGLDAPQAAVIDLGRAIFYDHKVNAATYARAEAIFGRNKLVDLVLLMGNYAGTAALLTAFDVQLLAGDKPSLPIP